MRKGVLVWRRRRRCGDGDSQASQRANFVHRRMSVTVIVDLHMSVQGYSHASTANTTSNMFC